MELEYFNQYTNVMGVDEVGRGPLAGPVVSCAVQVIAKSGKVYQALNDFLADLEVTDSKKLSDKKRKSICTELGVDVHTLEPSKVYTITENDDLKIVYCVGEVSAEDIDEMNILQASLFSMKLACLQMIDDSQTALLIDGNQFLKLKKKNVNEYPIVKGDSKSLIIGLASVIAKQYRDELMVELAQQYPEYGFEKHAGYPTKQHKEAIANVGPSKIHRLSFKGVKEYSHQNNGTNS